MIGGPSCWCRAGDAAGREARRKGCRRREQQRHCQNGLSHALVSARLKQQQQHLPITVDCIPKRMHGWGWLVLVKKKGQKHTSTDDTFRFQNERDSFFNRESESYLGTAKKLLCYQYADVPTPLRNQNLLDAITD